MDHWSVSLKERIEADLSKNEVQLQAIADERLRSCRVEPISEGNHTRLNAFWLFIGYGNSDKEDWIQVPRKSITLGSPHFFESVDAKNPLVSKATYHKNINSVLMHAAKTGFVPLKEIGKLSHSYVGNLNLSDIVAKDYKTKVKVAGRMLNQNDELKNVAKIENLTRLIDTCSPAFVVTSPVIFDTLKDYYGNHIENNFSEEFKKYRLEIWSLNRNTSSQTVFIRLPTHISRCGQWKAVTFSLIPKAIDIAYELGWRPHS